MSERSQAFQVGDRVRVEAATTAGEIVAVEGAAGMVSVRVSGSRAEEFRIEQRGDLIVVVPERGMRRWLGGADIDLVVPVGATLDLRTTSGDVVVDVRVTELSVSLASGDVRAGDVARIATVRSAAGDISIGSVGERLEATTASGDVRIGQVERDLTVSTASGLVHIDRVGETASVKSASGDVVVSRFDGTDLQVATLSGDVRIGVPSRRLLDVDLQTLSGDLRNRLPEGEGGEPERSVSLRLKTVSGDVTLEGA
jgi:DUF4097 and DUF4098 domain-containing protein YvlB